MAETAVAFPDDDTTAALIVDRLAADGIIARIDRGIHGSWQLPARGHLSVVVSEKDAARARRALGTRVRPETAPGIAIRIAVLALIAVLAFALAALWIEVTR